MALKFHTNMIRPRFDQTHYPAETMRLIAEEVRSSVMKRILAGVDVHDGPAIPLRPSYAKFKAKRYPPAIRNWRMTGFTLGHMKVTSAAPRRAVIEFLDGKRPTVIRGVKSPVSVAYIVDRNQRRCRQFGLSPHDREVFVKAVGNVRYTIGFKVA